MCNSHAAFLKFYGHLCVFFYFCTVEEEVATFVGHVVVGRIGFLAFSAKKPINLLPRLLVGMLLTKQLRLHVADVADNVIDAQSLLARLHQQPLQIRFKPAHF